MHFLAVSLLCNIGTMRLSCMEVKQHERESQDKNRVPSLLAITAEKIIDSTLRSDDVEKTYSLFQSFGKVPFEMQEYVKSRIINRPLKRSLLHEAQSPKEVLQLVAGFGIDPTLRTVQDEIPLITLLRDGKREAAQFLLQFMKENCIPYDHRDIHGTSVLALAQRFGDEKMSALLEDCQAVGFIEKSATIPGDSHDKTQNPDEYTGLTSLHTLTHPKQIDTLRCLGADFTRVSKEKQLPLHYYIKTGKFACALHFLQTCDTNFDIYTRDALGMTYLAYAICVGHHELITILLAKGSQVLQSLKINGKASNHLLLFLDPRWYQADLVPVIFCDSVLNKLSVIRRMQLLQKAVRYGYDPVVKIVLGDKTFETLVDNNGTNFIMYLAMNNHNATLKKVLKTSPDLERTNYKGNTAIFDALIKKSKTLKTLLEHGADVNHQNNKGLLPLHCAIVKEQKFEEEDNEKKKQRKEYKLLDTLLAYHPLIDIGTARIGTPLLHAVSWNAVKQAQLLLKAGANPCAVDSDGKTVLHHAIRCCLPTFLYYLGHTIKPILNARDNDGNTALHYAIDKGNRSLVQNLIALGADVDCQDAEGRTPLMLALQNNLEQTVRHLLNRGANVKLTDNKGKNCVDYVPNDNSTEYYDILAPYMREL